MSSQWESSWLTIAVTFLWKHCGIMAAGRIPTSTKTKGLTPGVFWEFSLSPLGMIHGEGGGGGRQQHLIQCCQNNSGSL